MEEAGQIPSTQQSENVQAENQPQVAESPIEEPPKEKGPIRKIFDRASWYVFFTLLPGTVLILVSQNTIPGDLFYPIKRSMENVVLAAASVNPATRAAFRTDLTTRRFDEAEKLLLASSDINGLKDFITAIQSAQNEVSTISDPVKKQELQEKIQTSVIEYEKRLDSVKVQLVTREQSAQLAFGPTASPTDSQAISSPIQPTTSLPTNTPVPLPTSTPKPLIPSKATATSAPVPSTNLATGVQVQAPTVTPKQIAISIPTQTPIPNLTSTPIPLPPLETGGGTIGAVDKVQEYLRCLQNTPPPHSQCTPPAIHTNSALQLERRNEERLKHAEQLEERKEEQKQIKETQHEEEREESGKQEARQGKKGNQSDTLTNDKR